jgi:hypothetical protein
MTSRQNTKTTLNFRGELANEHSFTIDTDTIDYVHGMGNMPTHSIEKVLFQCGTFLSVKFKSRFHALLSTSRL